MQQLVNRKYRRLRVINQHNERLLELAEAGDTKVVLKSMPLANSERLQNEIVNYKALVSASLNGVAHVVDSFKFDGRLYMVLPYFSHNLEEYKQKCNGRFSLKTTLMLTLQMLERIRYVHSLGLVHGDIKPENFLMGLGKLKHKVFLIDFQLSKRFIQADQHIKPVERDHIDGTLRFLSLAANQGLPVVRRDDIESLLYCAIYFMKGDLPWTSTGHTMFLEAYDHIRKLKQSSEETICSGCPPLFPELLRWARKIGFAQQPDYDFLKEKLLALFRKNGYEMDYFYDWEFL